MKLLALMLLLLRLGLVSDDTLSTRRSCNSPAEPRPPKDEMPDEVDVPEKDELRMALQRSACLSSGRIAAGVLLRDVVSDAGGPDVEDVLLGGKETLGDTDAGEITR